MGYTIPEWEFKHSIYTEANRMDAWAYWSDTDNNAKMEPGVKRIELDGPFETGTTGHRTYNDRGLYTRMATHHRD